MQLRPRQSSVPGSRGACYERQHVWYRHLSFLGFITTDFALRCTHIQMAFTQQTICRSPDLSSLGFVIYKNMNQSDIPIGSKKGKKESKRCYTLRAIASSLDCCGLKEMGV